MTTDQQSPDAFDWASLVARVLHPLEVQIIEAMWWVDRPLVAGDLARLLDDAVAWPILNRHLRRLASLGVIELSVPRTTRDIAKVKYRLVPRPQ